MGSLIYELKKKETVNRVMFHQILEYEQSLRIQSSHPKLFFILGTDFSSIHYVKSTLCAIQRPL